MLGILAIRSVAMLDQELGYPAVLHRDHCGLGDFVMARKEE